MRLNSAGSSASNVAGIRSPSVMQYSKGLGVGRIVVFGVVGRIPQVIPGVVRIC